MKSNRSLLSNYKLLIPSFLFLGLIVSSIYPLINFYSEKELPTIPKHMTYDSAFVALTLKIKDLARKNRCEGTIKPISTINSDVMYPISMIHDLNYALLKYDGWSLLVSELLAEEIRAHLNRILTEWGSEFTGDELERLLVKRKETIIPTHFVKAYLDTVVNLGGDDTKLRMEISESAGMSVVFLADVMYSRPETIAKWESNKIETEREILSLQTKNRLGMHGVTIFGIGLGLYGFLFGISFLSLIIQIKKRQVFVENGHFVAAMKLTDRYLKYFPNNIDIVAFKERLLDFTNNDPKKAQIALVEAKKLQARLRIAQVNPREAVLGQEEKDTIAQLLSYNPELNVAYQQLTSATKEYEQELEIEKRVQSVDNLMHVGDVAAAEEEMSALNRQYGEVPTVAIIRQKVERIKEQLIGRMIEVISHLKSGDIQNAKDKLASLLTAYPKYTEANDLQLELKEAQGVNRFRLSMKKQDKTIDLFLGNQVVIGRTDVDVAVDIEVHDRRVSRPHAKLVVLSESVKVEDVDSTGGTFINGKKISTSVLRNGDTLTLAKIIDYRVLIFRDNDRVGGVCLSGEDSDYLIISSKISFDLDRNQRCIPGSGISVYWEEGITIITGDDDAIPLYDGMELILNEKAYTVEALQ